MKKDSVFNHKAYLSAKQELIDILAPYTEEFINKRKIEYARLTDPLSTFPDDLLPEQWVPLVYDGIVLNKYSISSWGRLYDLKDGLNQVTHICDRGYIRAGLTGTIGKSVGIRIHILVAHTFIPKIEGKLLVNHKDLNKTNNVVSNLMWADDKESIRHAVANGARANKSRRLMKPQDIIDIKKRHENNETIASIAIVYNTKPITISGIVNGKSYTDTFWHMMGYSEPPL